MLIWIINRLLNKVHHTWLIYNYCIILFNVEEIILISQRFVNILSGL